MDLFLYLILNKNLLIKDFSLLTFMSIVIFNHFNVLSFQEQKC